MTQGIDGKEEEKSTQKEIYQEFFPQLIDAFSDDQTHRSLVSELYSRSLISEEEKGTRMSSTLPPKTRGSSLLKVLGVEEKPHLLTELITAMMGVEELQPLAEEMSAQLSKTKQGSLTSVFVVMSNVLISIA